MHTIAEAERRTIVALSAAKASSPDAEVGSLCSAAITYLEDLRRLGGAKFDSQYVTAKLPATLAGLMAATGATNDASRGKLDVPVLRLEVDTLRELCEVSSLTRRMVRWEGWGLCLQPGMWRRSVQPCCCTHAATHTPLLLPPLPPRRRWSSA